MATLTADTVQNVLEIVSDLRGETTTNTNASRIRAVSRAERDFASRMFWRVHLLRDQTTTGDGVASSFAIGSSSYPMRMKGLTEVFVGGTNEENRHQIVDYNQFKELYNADNSTKMVHEWYDVANDLWKMKINPVPADDDVITYSYYWEPPKRTTIADLVICPDMKILALMAMHQIYMGEDEKQKADATGNESEQMIDYYMGIENAPAVNQTYQVRAIENVGRNRGIGSY